MTWILSNYELILERLLGHLGMALPPILLSLALAIPIAWLALRVSWLRGPITALASLMYAIPSLPLFIVIPLMIGTGIRNPVNVVLALTLYGLALMVPATVDALRGVDPAVRGAAEALGYTPTARFFTVELPLAIPPIIAGLRVVAVSTISLTTVGAVLGVPSLGLLFTDGLQRGIISEILTGIVLTTALALLFDRLLAWLGGRLTPWLTSSPTPVLQEASV
ncbi:ABC transporter permease [Parenemella sanctibonifatiensis]|uniref:ABC transporter permease n=1 Tax=Parenemella sanctibonifatiensis TaxID=2016505 RepID=A0A255DZ25_9ACTN|nr:ABC transporter permease [Parenemella sanctibonifatiensis]OYN84599.1 ABC transporter permease [Parenemella sanctibonifatiensis]